MIVVTAPYGKIGSKLLARLLVQEAPVRLIARDPAKLDSAVRERLDVVQGSIDDASVLERAFAGAEALFWLVPSPATAPSVVDHYRRFWDPAAAAGVGRVVTVSSLYRGAGPDAGPLFAVTAMDEAFARTGAAYRAIWSANHMDNLLRQVEPLRQGVLSLPAPPDVKMPLVATDDVARVAAGLLGDRSWTGRGGVAAMGPQDLSHSEMAATLGEVLGRSIRFQSVSEPDFTGQMTGRGASADVARWLFDMFHSGGETPHGAAPSQPQTETPTTFRRWCEQVLKPALST